MGLSRGKRLSSMLGDQTKKFLLFLAEHGPQTAKQLESQPFWKGVGSRICMLVAQGRIERVSVANPFVSERSRAVSVAYKFVEGSNIGPLNVGRRVSETFKERVKREKKGRAVARAIKLLEEQGYSIKKT